MKVSWVGTKRATPAAIGHRSLVGRRYPLGQHLPRRRLDDVVRNRTEATHAGNEVHPPLPAARGSLLFVGEDLAHDGRQLLRRIGRQPPNRNIRQQVVVEIRIPVVRRDRWLGTPQDVHLGFGVKGRRRYSPYRFVGIGSRICVTDQDNSSQSTGLSELADVCSNCVGGLFI